MLLKMSLCSGNRFSVWVGIHIGEVVRGFVVGWLSLLTLVWLGSMGVGVEP